MVRLLSNRAVFSWNFLLQRIFWISVFSRRSKARQTAPTHLRSLSPRRKRNSDKQRNLFRQNQSTGESQHTKAHLEIFFFILWNQTVKQSTEHQKPQPFLNASISLSFSRSLEGDRDQRQINKSRKLFFFWDVEEKVKEK